LLFLVNISIKISSNQILSTKRATKYPSNNEQSFIILFIIEFDYTYIGWVYQYKHIKHAGLMASCYLCNQKYELLSSYVMLQIMHDPWSGWKGGLKAAPFPLNFCLRLPIYSYKFATSAPWERLKGCPLSHFFKGYLPYPV